MRQHCGDGIVVDFHLDTQSRLGSTTYGSDCGNSMAISILAFDMEISTDQAITNRYSHSVGDLSAKSVAQYLRLHVIVVLSQSRIMHFWVAMQKQEMSFLAAQVHTAE